MSYGSRKRGLWPKGVWPPSSPAYNVEPVTKHFVVLLCEQRTTDAAVSARRLPPSLAALFFTLRDSYGWQHCRPVCSEARYSSRIAFLPTPPAFDVPVRAVPVGISPPRLVWKTRMVWQLDGENISKICLFILTWSTNVKDTQTDRHTDTAWRHRPRLCIASRGKNQCTGPLCDTWGLR